MGRAPRCIGAGVGGAVGPLSTSLEAVRFLPDLEIRPSSIAANPVESREASPSSIVYLTSQRHPEKLPEVTGTSRGAVHGIFQARVLEWGAIGFSISYTSNT